VVLDLVREDKIPYYVDLNLKLIPHLLRIGLYLTTPSLKNFDGLPVHFILENSVVYNGGPGILKQRLLPASQYPPCH
jgi:hypothetical protein